MNSFLPQSLLPLSFLAPLALMVVALFAARLGEQGHDHLYFEDTAGGHSNDADPVANARRWARHYVYLAQQLMD